jgi:hypothetical protein
MSWREPDPTKEGSAGSPIDFVSEAGLVRVLQNFISGLMFTRIDFERDYEEVRAADRASRSRLSPDLQI